MKLSEAIRMNGMMRPQGFGPESIASVEAPCAIGGALQVIGKQIIGDTVPNYQAIKRNWPWLRGPVQAPEGLNTRDGVEIIWHLNDIHRWTRQQIADWVATVEPAEQESATLIAEVVHA